MNSFVPIFAVHIPSYCCVQFAHSLPITSKYLTASVEFVCACLSCFRAVGSGVEEAKGRFSPPHILADTYPKPISISGSRLYPSHGFVPTLFKNIPPGLNYGVGKNRIFFFVHCLYFQLEKPCDKQKGGNLTDGQFSCIFQSSKHFVTTF